MLWDQAVFGTSERFFFFFFFSQSGIAADMAVQLLASYCRCR